MSPSLLEKAQEALARHFGFSELRPFQVEALEAWSQRRDVYLALGTGSGKSICFQLPPLLGTGFSLVISPLISLMQDQVRTLRQRRIRATLCGSAGESFDSLASGYQLVYMCPEFALAHLAQLAQLKDQVCLLAIDEAHCISAWGNDFRPSYAQLGQVREALGRPVTMAISATSAQVKADIFHCLKISPLEICGSLNRPNLKYMVRPRSTLEEDFGELFGLKQSGPRLVENSSITCTSSCIVYVSTRARSEEISQWLCSHNVKSAAYHAGLAAEAKEKCHAAFMLDELQVVVATVAFGMGIDKPSVRRVVFYGGIRSLEDFVQMGGRAGRDGEGAEVVAFVAASDAAEQRRLALTAPAVYSQRLLAMCNEMSTWLTDTSECRRLRLLRHFGEAPKEDGPATRGECVRSGGQVSCGWCDVCLTSSTSSRADFTVECRQLLRCVEACGRSGRELPCAVCAGHYTEKVKQRKLENHRAFGSGKQRSLQWWKALLPLLLQHGLLQEVPGRLASGRSYAALVVSQQGLAILSHGSFVVSLTPELAPKEPKAPKAPKAPTATVRSAAYDGSLELYKRLSHVRQSCMRRLNIMGEVILSNQVLRAMAQQAPNTRPPPGLPAELSDELREVVEALMKEIHEFNGGRHGHDADVGPPVLRTTRSTGAAPKRCAEAADEGTAAPPEKLPRSESAEGAAAARLEVKDDWLSLLEM